MKKLLYGAAYYDEYMPYDRLQQDVAMMKKAGINTVRIAESTWSTCEPQEGVFDFSHVERVMDAMEEAGINVIIGTPTYAIPTWMVKSHPDVMAETVKDDEAVLKQIDKEIPYHILFVLTCNGKAQAWIGYKEAAASGSNAFKVSRYYHTDWMPEDELHLSIDGLNMDAVYESLVRQIAGDKLQTDSGESLKESVERDEKKKQLERQIAALESKMRREKQLNRRMEINAELKKSKKELFEI